MFTAAGLLQHAAEHPPSGEDGRFLWWNPIVLVKIYKWRLISAIKWRNRAFRKMKGWFKFSFRGCKMYFSIIIVKQVQIETKHFNAVMSGGSWRLLCGMTQTVERSSLYTHKSSISVCPWSFFKLIYFLNAFLCSFLLEPCKCLRTEDEILQHYGNFEPLSRQQQNLSNNFRHLFWTIDHLFRNKNWNKNICHVTYKEAHLKSPLPQQSPQQERTLTPARDVTLPIKPGKLAQISAKLILFQRICAVVKVTQQRRTR